MRWQGGRARAVVALAAAAVVAVTLGRLWQQSAPLAVTPVSIGATPATVYRLPDTRPAPVVVIAHGFAGSKQLMQAFAITLARNGLVALTFDFLGHGGNARPLPGGLVGEEEARRALLAELDRVVAHALGLPGVDGRLALLGHSMASDIVVRHAQADPRVAATVAVSMFAPTITADSPRNLLVLAGDQEGWLKRQALDAVALSAPDGDVRPGVTYGGFETGTARRAAFAPWVGHVGVLYSVTSLREARNWLARATGRDHEGFVARRGPWVVLLIGALVVLAWPLARLLPVLGAPPPARLRRWRPLLAAAGLPAVLTPLVLWLLPLDFLPVLVGDYLAAHFAVYGGLTLLAVRVLGGRETTGWPGRATIGATALAALAITLYVLGGPGLAIDAFVTAFVPIAPRVPVVLAVLLGTLLYFLADERLAGAAGGPRGIYAVSKVLFLLSIAGAIALDLEHLFFLIIVFPFLAVLFLVLGLLRHWVRGRTGETGAAAIASAIVFAWAIGVTFPLVAE